MFFPQVSQGLSLEFVPCKSGDQGRCKTELARGYQTLIQHTVRHRGTFQVLIVQILGDDVNMGLLLHALGTFNAEANMRAAKTINVFLSPVLS